jgi:hypothetical protein
MGQILFLKGRLSRKTVLCRAGCQPAADMVEQQIARIY